MSLDLPSDFNYSPSFIRIFIPGISFIVFLILIPLSTYLYFTNPRFLSELIYSDKISLGIVLVSISIILGIYINSMELPLSRFLEGYSLKDILPQRVFNRLQTYQNCEFLKLLEARNDIVKSIDVKKLNLQRDRLYERINNYYLICLYYIYHVDLNEEEIRSSLMPTTFGNILRSIEVYPNWKYGMDGVFFWPRIASSISESERYDLDHKNALMNMHLYLCIIFGLSYFVSETLAIFFMGKTLGIIYSLIAILFLYLSICNYNMLLVSSVSYGQSIKSIFDLHRMELLEKLNLKSMKIDHNDDEKEIWKSIKEYLYYPSN